jgi:apolipoprotein N-acyltransferase
MFLNLILSALAGAMMAASYPMSFVPGGQEWSWPWLAFIAPVPLFFALRRAGGLRQALVIGFVAGIVLNAIGLFWISSFGPLALSLLVAYQAAVFAFVCGGLHVLLRYPSDKLNFILIPGYWIGAEYLRSFGAMGFPWLLTGYTQYDNAPVVQLSAFGGVYAASFFVVLGAYSIFHLLGARAGAGERMRAVLISAVVLAFSYGWGYYAFYAVERAQLEMPTQRVAVVQGGIASDAPWSLEEYQTASHRAYVGATEYLLRTEAPPDLVVWPESALPMFIDLRQPVLEGGVQQLWAEYPYLKLLLGTLAISQRGLHNSAVVYANPYSFNGVYSKTRLVPYGEFVPLAPVARLLDYPWGPEDVVEGLSLDPLRYGRYTVGVNICFDSVYPPVARDEVRRGAAIIAVIANNSWYKLPSGASQHAMMDFFRAAENRRSLVRASTTGVSCFVLPSGRQVGLIGRGLNEWRTEVLPINETYSLYGRVGDLFAVILLCIAAAGLTFRSFTGGGEDML